MTILCNNCDMHHTGKTAPGWHGVKKVRSAKEATTIESVPMQTWTDPSGDLRFIDAHEDFDDWWTHEGWCPECVSAGRCLCRECCEKTLFDEASA